MTAATPTRCPTGKVDREIHLSLNPASAVPELELTEWRHSLSFAKWIPAVEPIRVQQQYVEHLIEQLAKAAGLRVTIASAGERAAA